MPVSSEMFHQLSFIYRSYSDASDKTDFIKKNRKIIKILTDSIWEQVVNNLFSISPRSYMDARFIINSNISKLELDEDIAVAAALLEVLKEYDALIEKNYIDISNKIKPILAISLRRLCLSLAQHRNHKYSDYAVTLRTILIE